MITDPPPKSKEEAREFDASDALRTIDLPPAEPLQAASRALEAALKAGDRAGVKRAGDEILGQLARFYGIAPPGLSVLGSRPKSSSESGWSWELFGDYDLETAKIRVWMKTAVLGKVTSYRGLLNTLLHEFLHHLDVVKLGFGSTPHTRGFYARVDELYHLALATPPEKRKPLAWIRSRNVWRIDWSKLRTTS